MYPIGHGPLPTIFVKLVGQGHINNMVPPARSERHTNPSDSATAAALVPSNVKTQRRDCKQQK
eukprot:6488703-Amphidinium_carterae.1